jgi:hypothetical protein
LPDLDFVTRTRTADVTALTGNALDARGAVEEIIIGFDFAIITAIAEDDSVTPLPIIEVVINTPAADADVTAPTVSSVTSAALTAATVVFSEQICTDQAGTLLVAGADVKSKFTVSRGTATIVSAIVSSDQTEIVFAFGGTGLVANDTVSRAVALYDQNGNALAATQLAKVNAGATAWVVI